MPHKQDWGYTVTDLFCGAGGSSEGAMQAGATPRLAFNHWKRAIETHNSNFPECDHECGDVQASDPRRYRSTNILIASPECTNHSLAKGAKRLPYKQDLFGNVIYDPSAERSRATMWDVPRFAEYHKYEIVIVENVVDAMRWIPFPAWLQSMHLLGYEHEVVCLNSMFCLPTPQSRDRMYVVFWRKGNPKPNLKFTPPAPCAHCDAVLPAQQTWKNGRTWGKYKQQYIYTCPKCRNEVTPFYFAAMNAIDWSIPAERIGDRKRPLKDKTMQRIAYGLERFGRSPLIVSPRYKEGIASRVHDATVEAMPTQPTDSSHAVAYPYMFMQNEGERAKGLGEALPTQTTSRGIVNIVFPAILSIAHSQANGNYVYGSGGSMPTQTTTQDLAIMGFLSTSGRNADPSGLNEPIGTFATREHHGLVMPPFMFPVNLSRDRFIDADDPFGTQTANLEHGLVSPMLVSTNDYDPRTLDAAGQPMGTQTTQDKWAMVSPFIAEMHNTSTARGLNEALMCIMTGSHHALITPNSLREYCQRTGQPIDADEMERKLAALTVNDLTFRMLKSHEIQRGMAFRDDYIVTGNTEERIKQLGNAVTPPAMRFLAGACIATLDMAG